MPSYTSTALAYKAQVYGIPILAVSEILGPSHSYHA